ncbi:MAG: hypothetical protein IJL92_08230 [Thermoguttaceae bacterium]|nr:hypothetical protein [Thermoguttaceae bacterium]
MRRLFFVVYVLLSLATVPTPTLADDDERPDWLLNPAPYVSEILFDENAKELTLSNGLIERRILLAPNAATVSLRNLTTGEELIRALAPEARVTIDGNCYPVGGLTGAPVANYWKEEWKAEAKPLEGAYAFDRFETGEIEERFPYKKRPEWLSRDLPWPPKGKRVSLFFNPPRVLAPVESGKKLFEESFLDELDGSWRVHLSEISPRITVVNEGKPGEIFAPTETCAYLEREWLADAAALKVALDVGDETRANSWGPGVALLFPGKTVSVVARPYSRQYELCVDGAEKLVGSFDRDKEIVLAFSLEKNENAQSDAERYWLVAEGRQEGAGKTTVGRVAVPSLPQTLRVGKVGKAGFGKDYPKAQARDEDFARVHIKNVALFAPVPEDVKNEIAKLPNLEVRYEVYDGAPLISKKLVVSCPENMGDAAFTLDSFVNEELRLVEPESSVEYYEPGVPFNLGLMSDYVYGGIKSSHLYDTEAWKLKTDPDYPTQVNYARITRCLLECSPELGPAQIVDKDRTFESNAIYEILFDNSERERRGLAFRRAMRILAPWTAENPLMFHKVKSSPEEVREGIEQCRETGFEVLIMSFGSGFNLESKDPEYRKLYAGLSEEARAAKVALGGYSLTSSRSAGVPADNVHNPKPRFGRAPCLQSAWGLDYFQGLKDFMEIANFGVFENDGPYPGDFCEATDHPGHRGKEDSIWTQWRAQSELYRWCRAHGVYVNQPDAYFLEGGNKTGMGYRETNWSLPRAEQVIIERQNVYDGTWDKTASMGWMFVPLSQYHGGGAAATIEPLKDHLDHYDARFANLIGSGTQACWRGPRLFDSEETKKVVVKWTSFYKEYRRILDGDLIHLRRATGRDWDGWLHVDPDPEAEIRGLAFFYNPTRETITRKIVAPLYYAGLRERAVVRLGDSNLRLAEPKTVELNDRREAIVEITIPAESYAWATFEESKEPVGNREP